LQTILKKVAVSVASPWGPGARAPLEVQQFIFSSLWSKSENQLFKYCVVC